MEVVRSHMVSVLARLFLALVLALGFVPMGAVQAANQAWAAEPMEADGEGQDDEQARLEEEQRQAEEEARRAAEEAARAEEEARQAEEQRQREEEEQRQAEEAQQKALADQAAADSVIALIDALPSAMSAVGADEAAATNAVNAFNALTQDQRHLVPVDRIDKLNAVVAAVAAAIEAEAQKQNQGTDPGEDETGSQTEKYYVKTLLLKWDKPDDQGVTHYVGDSPIVERAYQAINITSFGEAVQLRGFYMSTDGTGNAYQTADSSTAIGSFELNWRSSDDTVATVTPDGLVRPQGRNGQVTITVSVADPNVYQGEAPVATVLISFDGQEGKYVKQVEILDEGGNNIGEAWGGVTVYNEENAFHQLQARVTWCNVVDGSETVQITGAGEDYDAANVDTTLTWNVSTSSAFSINEDTGRLRCTSYSGNAYVTCTAIGGLGGALVTDTANVQLDTGVYEYNPADSLTLKVVWEERPDQVVKEATYSYSDLLGMLNTYHANATVVSGSRFGVISADGFLFKDVVNLVAVDDADVLQYRFQTADGYDNPISYRYLFESGNRYYFPNYELGGSRAEGEIVPPLLAYQSSFEWNRSEVNPNTTLDEGTRFRLVFGCLGSGDANTSYQIYYINGITVVLKGGPSAGGGGGNGPQQDLPSGDPSTDSADPEENPGDDGSEGGNGSNGNSNGGASGKPGQGGTGSDGSGTSARAGGNGNAGENSADAGSSRGSQARNLMDSQSSEQAKNEPAEAAGTDVGSSKRWRVYQMMNKTNSDVPDWDDENPMSPFAAPAVLGTFALGIGATGINFRRRLK